MSEVLLWRTLLKLTGWVRASDESALQRERALGKSVGVLEYIEAEVVRAPAAQHQEPVAGYPKSCTRNPKLYARNRVPEIHTQNRSETVYLNPETTRTSGKSNLVPYWIIPMCFNHL